MPGLKHLGTGVRIPPPPFFVRRLSVNEDRRGGTVLTVKPGFSAMYDCGFSMQRQGRRIREVPQISFRQGICREALLNTRIISRIKRNADLYYLPPWKFLTARFAVSIALVPLPDSKIPHDPFCDSSQNRNPDESLCGP